MRKLIMNLTDEQCEALKELEVVVLYGDVAETPLDVDLILHEEQKHDIEANVRTDIVATLRQFVREKQIYMP